MIIIHGAINQGKTTFIKKIISFLNKKNKTIGGLYTQKIIKNEQVIGYDIVLINNNESFPFLRLSGLGNQQKIGPYFIDGIALIKGKNEIEKAIINNVDYLIIDEVGKLELNNNGWSVVLEKAIHKHKREIILAVRTDFVDEVIQKWELKGVRKFLISDEFLDLTPIFK